MFCLASQGRVCSRFWVPWWGVAHNIFLCIWLQSCLQRGRMWPGAKCVFIVQVFIGLGNIHVWVSVSQGFCLRKSLLGVDHTYIFEFQCTPIYLFRSLYILSSIYSSAMYTSFVFSLLGSCSRLSGLMVFFVDLWPCRFSLRWPFAMEFSMWMYFSTFVTFNPGHPL